MDFVYVEDIARANILAAKSDATDDVFNVASGVETSLAGLAAKLLEVMGSDLAVRVRPGAGREQGLAAARRHRACPRRLGFVAEIDLEEGLADSSTGGGTSEKASAAGRPGGGVVMEVPFARPYLTGTEAAAVAEVIASGWVSQGPRVREFEQAFAEPRRSTRRGGDVELHDGAAPGALRLGSRPRRRGDRAVAVVHRHRQLGVAVRRRRRCSPTSIRGPTTSTRQPPSARSHRARGRSCRCIRWACRPTWTRSWRSATGTAWRSSRTRPVPIGATYKGRPIGSLGPLSCFSLHPRKVITTGEGGMIAVHDPEMADADAAAARSRHGRIRSRAPQRHATSCSRPTRSTGFNVRMTDMQAAMGLCQLEALPLILARTATAGRALQRRDRRDPRTRGPVRPALRDADLAVLLRPRQRAVADRPDGADAPTAGRRHPHAARRDGDSSRAALCAGQGLLPHTEAAARDVLMLPLFA